MGLGEQGNTWLVVQVKVSGLQEPSVRHPLSGLGAGHSDQMSLWGHLLQGGGVFYVGEEECTQICGGLGRVD